jgi:hypothetical protein
MSTIKSSDEHLTLNADGANNDIKFQSNGSEVASIDQAGVMTATSFAGSGANLTNLPSDVTVSATAPSSPSEGDLWFNSATSTVSSVVTKAMAVYNGTSWNQLSNVTSATGGTERTYTGYKSHTFTSSGTFQITQGSPACDILIVAGGGGGGGRHHGGGGGAGGVRVFTNQALTAGSYTITVGAGGGDVAAENVQGSMGNTSTFQSIASSSGGGGGAAYNLSGLSGGSGGGDNGGDDSINDSPGSGNAGGYSPVEGYAGAETTGNGAYVAGGGGGGASETGGHSNKVSDGGAGISNAFSTGSNISYGGGGCGSNGYSSTGQSGTPAATHGGGVMDAVGAANTGGGGGSGSTGGSPGKSGGSGIVVVRYAA